MLAEIDYYLEQIVDGGGWSAVAVSTGEGCGCSHLQDKEMAVEKAKSASVVTRVVKRVRLEFTEIVY